MGESDKIMWKLLMLWRKRMTNKHKYQKHPEETQQRGFTFVKWKVR